MTETAMATILLVEDEETDVALLRRGFENAGVLNPILHLSNGDHVLAYLAGEEEYADRARFPLPALILLDLKLPGMSGLQLLRWIRNRREIKRIPVVVLTTSDDAKTINAAYDCGANSYLVKPGNIARIADIVTGIQSYWIKLNQPPQLVMRAENASH